jgi:hypothetical protein
MQERGNRRLFIDVVFPREGEGIEAMQRPIWCRSDQLLDGNRCSRIGCLSEGRKQGPLGALRDGTHQSLACSPAASEKAVHVSF